MFVTEFGGPYQSSGLRPISIAMFDLIYAGKFQRQYLENGKEYKKKFGREGVQNRPPKKICPPFGETFWGATPNFFPYKVELRGI